MKKPTVIIGIPAYNEEENIARLLRQLLVQKQKRFFLKKIVVASDGSTDDTVKSARSVKNRKVTIMNFLARQGRAVVQEKIFQYADTDFVVLIDADTAIRESDFLERLVRPLCDGADLTAARVEEAQPVTVTSKILYASMQWKKQLFEMINEGDNVYTCHGRARGFSSRLYKSIHFPQSSGEDAYSYFFCKKKQFVYKYVQSAHIFYRLPSSFMDHLAQGRRYFAAKDSFQREFGRGVISRGYFLPFFLTIQTYVHSLAENRWLLLYFPLVIVTRILALFPGLQKDTWTIARSSKFLGGVL